MENSMDYDTSPINADDDVGVVHNIHKMLDEESCNFSSSAVDDALPPDLFEQQKRKVFSSLSTLNILL